MNTQKDYKFDGSISLGVLNNYLDRALTYHICRGAMPMEIDEPHFREAIRFIKNVGAKYIHRAVSSWYPTLKEIQTYPRLKELMDWAHTEVPDVVFEACIFETTTQRANEIPIPEWVFKAFGLPVEDRCFVADKMAFPDGYGLNHWEQGGHIPDITQLEEQMFVYYRAVCYIDLGFEALHLGQAKLIGRDDEGNKCWAKVVKMIRDYAKVNARRHYVLLNAHHNEFFDENGHRLDDVIVTPIRAHAAKEETRHEPSQTNPQRCIIEPEYWNAHIYKAGHKGTSPSGWYTDKYPYLVEFDNYGFDKSDVCDPAKLVWGMDEISWYANQPQWYRKEFIEYMYKTLAEYDENGHIALVGYRGSYHDIKLGKHVEFFASDKQFNGNGNGDEGFIKDFFSR